MFYGTFVFGSIGSIVSFARFCHEGCVASLGRVDGERGRIVHVPIFVSISVIVVIAMIVVVFHHRVNVVELEVILVRTVRAILMVVETVILE